VKPAKEWEEQLRSTHYYPEPRSGIPSDAFVTFIAAVQENARMSGFAEGFERGARVARAAVALASGEVPLGNNPAEEPT